jgi:hypothetical protein
MKWQWGILPLVLLGATVSQAQEPAPKTNSLFNLLSVAAKTDDVVPVDSHPTVLDNTSTDGGPEGFLTGNHSFPGFIGFLSNPLQNIDPRANTELFPVFISSWVSPFHPLPSGDMQLYGAGLNVALSERLCIGMNQGGYAVSKFGRSSHDGWLNLGGYVQYTLIEDVPDQFLLTGGMRWEAPTGEASVFQGHGPAVLATYLTAGKEYCDFHVLGTFGFQFPAGSGDSDVRLFYGNVHFDRRMFGWLYPVLEFNWTYHESSVNVAFDTPQGFFNFGTFEGSGNILAMAVGFNAVLSPEKVEAGIAYTTSLATQRDFDFDGLIVKMIFRY